MAPEIQENDLGGTLEHRVERLQYYATRQGHSISEISRGLEDVRRRMSALEEDRHARAVADARAEEREKAMLSELVYVKEALKALKGVLNKAIGVIFTAVALATVNWVLTGSLFKGLGQ